MEQGLQQLFGELKRAHRDQDALNDRELFFRLVKESMEALHLEDADIAGKMPASRSAISRWRRGLNAPLPMARGNVLKFFMKRVRRAVRQQEQASKITQAAARKQARRSTQPVLPVVEPEMAAH